MVMLDLHKVTVPCLILSNVKVIFLRPYYWPEMYKIIPSHVVALDLGFDLSTEIRQRYQITEGSPHHLSYEAPKAPHHYTQKHNTIIM